MIVFDADFVRMPLLPAECDAVLVVNPDAVSARLVALQQLQPVARRNSEILEHRGYIQRLEFPLRHSPNLARNSSCGTGVSLAEQVSADLISE
jgi:hypothetical protein